MPRISRHLSLYYLLIWSVTALVLVGQTLPIFAAPSPQGAPRELRLAMPAPFSLDPTTLSRFDMTTRDVVENLFVGLTRFDPYTAQIEPVLARSWSVSEDGLTWTFELRQDISWVRYNPQTQAVEAVRPVVAGDFVYAIQRACDPNRPSPVTTNLMVIRGCLTVANAFPQFVNDLFIAREIGARATGPYTLQIDLLFPTGYLPSLLSTPEFRPLPREAIVSAQDWTQPSTILTSGPYVLQSWTAEGMTLIQNPFWPDSPPTAFERVLVSFTNETNTAVSLMAADRVDFARLSSTELDQARTALPDRLHVEPGLTLVVLGFSFERSMVELPSIRRALAAALNRSALSTQVFNGEMLPAAIFTPPDLVGAPTITVLESSPNGALARSHFEAAGYPNCAGVPEPLILWVPDDDPRWLALGQAVVSQWAEALGCNPSLFTVEAVSRTLLIEIAHSTYDAEKLTRPHVWLGTWSADYPDANAWLNDALHCRYGYFRVGRACDATDDLLDRAGSEADTAQRAQFYAEAERLFFAPESGTFPVIPLLFSANAWLQAPNLGKVNPASAARFDAWTWNSTE